MNNIGLKQEEVKCGPAPGEEEGIVVKTKFPVARIKRIVQADEDVGKVAQVTPLVVGKLFCKLVCVVVSRISPANNKK